ncbi:FMN-dependent NADH-azoreductase [Mycoplasma zalophidermidis]|uniref:FMN-dependent NADH-azoreductase n=1 Tax=Mycoplasma zalophidermidis TaxID=398174 RepID=UPI001C125108|nr:FMN-dependent NADH-azoreductase [Mycoplasma zalophidermidis]MBU4690041.1 FMN-dependent NADH-azoreductase [Mycoplasma zalophidermidis]
MKSLKILSVTGTVNKDSLSQKINNEMIKKLMEKHQNSFLTRLDTTNSEFVRFVLNAEEFNDFFKNVDSDQWINILHDTDVLVLSTPMVNFSYSAGIKNFIDAIAVANKTFSYKYSKKGESVGLLDKLKVILIGTQGAPVGWYPFAAFLDNLKGIFEFLGAKSVDTLLVDGNKVAPRSEMTHEEIIEEINPKLLSIIDKF